MDREKFIEIYKRYYPELCLFLGNFSADADKNKDIVQDVFLKLAREDSEKIRNVRGWLYYAARNAMLNHLRNEKSREKCLLDSALQMPVLDFDQDSLSLEERLEMVENAISALPQECRDIFVMAKQEGMSYKDIAAAKGISPKTVATQMGIALSRIREYCRAQKFKFFKKIL